MDDERVPFEDAKLELVTFRRSQGWPTDLLWVTRDRLLGYRGTHWVSGRPNSPRTPRPAHSTKRRNRLPPASSSPRSGSLVRECWRTSKTSEAQGASSTSRSHQIDRRSGQCLLAWFGSACESSPGRSARVPSSAGRTSLPKRDSRLSARSSLKPVRRKRSTIGRPRPNVRWS
jgi:hypothetical protein